MFFSRAGSGDLANGSSWRNGFAMEAVRGALDLCWREVRLAKIYAGHHPDNHASKHFFERLGFTFVEAVFCELPGLLHPSYICYGPDPVASK